MEFGARDSEFGSGHGRCTRSSLNPPSPALAKAGAAPGTTAGVELWNFSFLASEGQTHLAANRHPNATSMASYGRPSLPFASP